MSTQVSKTLITLTLVGYWKVRKETTGYERNENHSAKSVNLSPFWAREKSLRDGEIRGDTKNVAGSTDQCHPRTRHDIDVHVHVQV